MIAAIHPSRANRSQIGRLWAEQHGQCFFCPALLDPGRAAARADLAADLLRRFRGWTRDHLVPRAAGGPDRVENIVLACVVCNQRKADRMPTRPDLLRYELMRRHGVWVPPSGGDDAPALELALRAAVARIATAGGLLTLSPSPPSGSTRGKGSLHERSL